jgi:hypothetical protein
LDTIGYSWEGRPILCLKVSDNVGIDEDQPELMYMGNHHAREWITVEVPLRLAMMLTDSFGVNPALTALVNSREFFIIPSVNPDGFDYDYNTNNYWRKNRRNNGDGTYGVDLNRNYDGSQNGDAAGDWGGAGSSHSTADLTYCGPAAFSEPEAQAIRDFFMARQIGMSMSYHTYSELVMWPWGYTADPAPDVAILSALGIEMAGLISSETGSGTYTPQQAMTLYPTTGSSEEWLYGYSRYQSGLTDLAYITEMGYYDFHDTLTSTVNQICAQNLEAAIYMAQAAASPYSYVVPGAPSLAASDTMPSGGDFSLSWTPANTAAGIDRYQLHQLTGLTRFADNAESGIGAWDTTRFKISTNRPHSPGHSFRADSALSLNSSLVSITPITVRPGDSLSYWRWVSTEAGWDYFYCDVSADGGATWTNLETLDGAYKTWTRRSFSLAAFHGEQLTVRFRYTTDSYILEGGVYLDDISPVERFAADSVMADTITATSYPVAGLTEGTYYYAVRAHNAKGWGGSSNLVKVAVPNGVAGDPAVIAGLPQAYQLGLAYPNPARSTTAISYQLQYPGHVSLRIYNVAGQLVRTLASGNKPAGCYTTRWDGRDQLGKPVAAGVYLYRLDAGSFAATNKLVVVR